jgi:hypothetical protein
VPGALVRLQGAGVKTTQTSDDGEYAFDDVESGAWALEPNKGSDFGDAISSLDAAWVLQAVVGLRVLTEEQRLACDVTGDGTISSLDAARILQFSVRMISRMPVATACNSDWTFLPAPEPVQSSLMVPPHVAADQCAPGRIMIESLDSEAVDQNFQAVLFGDCTGNWRPATAAAETAPGKHAPRVQVGKLERHGGTLRARLYVRTAGEFHSLNAQLAYDGSKLQLLRATTRRAGRGAIVAASESSPGDARLAIASADAIGGRRGAIIDLVFAPLGDARFGRVDVVRANVDDQLARSRD